MVHIHKYKDLKGWRKKCNASIGDTHTHTHTGTLQYASQRMGLSSRAQIPISYFNQV